MASTLPPSLPVLPLPRNIVLYPNQLVSIQLQSRHAIALIRSVVDDAASGSSKLVIACVPLKPTDPVVDEASQLFSSNEPKDRNPETKERDSSATSPEPGKLERDDRKLQVIKVPSDQDSLGVVSTLADGRPLPEELYEYGTAARIVRLERLSAGGFLAVLEGLARISIDPTSYPSPPALSSFYTARITLVPGSAPLPVAHAPLLTRLREMSLSILTTLPGSATPLAPLFDRKLRSQLSRLSATSASSVLDSLFHSLPVSRSTSITHSDKCRILPIPSLVDRLEFGLEVLTRVDGTLTSTKFNEDKAEPIEATKRQREYALMQQLLAIKQELDQIAAAETKRTPSSTSGTRPVRSARRVPAATDGDEEEEGDEMAELEKKVHEKAFSEEARKIALRELKRLKKTPPQGAEYGVIRTYIETLLAIPWTAADATPLPLTRDFIEQARKKLDEDHYGLTKIKKRLLEWLAVLRLQSEQQQAVAQTSTATVAAATELSSSTAIVPYVPRTPSTQSQSKSRLKSPIILLHGPPGVGKTSIARSLAEAMGRKFVRISLGGVRDEAEIRGHRRTYVGALPGKLIAALRKAGTSNPVILLDEIDKMGHASHHGDPSAAMLEVLDPEQNWCFEDHYLGIPVDLSQVLFIATANSLETISEPLYDRMEPVELSGYIHDEKLHIARQKLLPKQLDANGLDSALVSLPDSTILHLIQHYTREAGVRSLERELGAVCRAKAVEYSRARDEVRVTRDGGGDGSEIDLEAVISRGYRPGVSPEDLEQILGSSRHVDEELAQTGRVGVSTGLAYQGSGNGGILHIETTLMPGTGRFHLTGQLGEVISESAHLAFAWVKSHAHELGISDKADHDVFKHVDLHLHLPAGGVKKDGPSAGVAIVVAIVSLMRGIPPKSRTAMTGEITLRGAVTPVGGIREKLLGAHRSGIKTVLLPEGNRKDVDGVDAGLPSMIKEEIDIVWIRSLRDVLEAAFPDPAEGRREYGWAVSRL
ncbi:hypothetical protein JCM16303_003051 [Sporobolomyces ruberrimus]